MTNISPNVNTPTTLEVPQLQANGSGQAIQVPANGGTIVNIGNVPIQVGPTSNPNDPSFTTLSIGTSMPWPVGQACWTFVQAQWNGVGEIQVQPVQSSYAPGSPGILPLEFTQLPANWNVSNAIPPGCTGIMIVASTVPSPNPQYIIRAQSPISNIPTDVIGPQIFWSSEVRLIAGTPIFIPFNSTLVEYLQLENVPSQPFVGLLAFALYGNDVISPSLGQTGGSPPGSVTVVGGEVINTGTLIPDHIEAVRVDSYGEPYTVITNPPGLSGDHPLVEKLYVAGFANSGAMLLNAPGAGVRYRLFNLSIICQSGDYAELDFNNSAAFAVRFSCGAIPGAPLAINSNYVEFSQPGMPLEANTGITLTNNATSWQAVTYTTEIV